MEMKPLVDLLGRIVPELDTGEASPLTRWASPNSEVEMAKSISGETVRKVAELAMCDAGSVLKLLAGLGAEMKPITRKRVERALVELGIVPPGQPA